MILGLTGTTPQGFDRFVRIVDEAVNQIGEDAVLQIGPTRTLPKHASYFRFASEKELDQLKRKARIIVGHGGIGTLIDAAQYQKPLIAIPRRMGYGEVSDDHQVRTLERFRRGSTLYVVEDAPGLATLLLREDLQIFTIQDSNPIINHLRDSLERIEEELSSPKRRGEFR